MNPLITITLAMNLLTTPDFCEGFSQGYRDGWIYDRSLHYYHDWAPECPAIMNWEETYMHGYLRGFLMAIEDRG